MPTDLPTAGGLPTDLPSAGGPPTDLRAEQLDTRGLIISIAAMVFLPLTFLTGLYGMNVANLPYAQEPWAFDAICGICATVSAHALSSRSSTVTANPSAASRRAIAAPIPRAAPVTIATRCSEAFTDDSFDVLTGPGPVR